VLTAFAHSVPRVGYCQVRDAPPFVLVASHSSHDAEQGLNFIAGMLILVVDDEVVCWRILVRLVSDILPDYFSESLAGIAQDQVAIRALLQYVLVSETHF